MTTSIRREKRDKLKFLLVLLVLLLVALTILLNETDELAARRSEAESISGSMATQLRVQYLNSGKAPSSSSESVKEILKRSEGEYSKGLSYQYRWDDENQEHRGVLTIAMKDPKDGVLVVDFNFKTGSSFRKWIDSSSD